jgi:hypothetical protein
MASETPALSCVFDLKPDTLWNVCKFSTRTARWSARRDPSLIALYSEREIKSDSSAKNLCVSSTAKLVVEMHRALLEINGT